MSDTALTLKDLLQAIDTKLAILARIAKDPDKRTVGWRAEIGAVRALLTGARGQVTLAMKARTRKHLSSLCIPGEFSFKKSAAKASRPRR